MGPNYKKSYEKDYQELMEKFEASQKENKELKKMNSDLNLIVSSVSQIKDTLNEFNNKVNELTNELKQKDELIQKLLDEIQRLKNNNKKDSSNSSKPSSTNGSKKISNSREKSNRNKGGQNGHKAHTLKIKDVEKIIKENNVKVIQNKIKDKNIKVPKYVIDLDIKVKITENKGAKIDKLNEVVYGNNIKSTAILLSANNYMSYDQIVNYFDSVTNGIIKLSKGTLVNWINEFGNKIESELKIIENDLLNGHYIQVDDSALKINGENSSQLCLCNKESVHLYASKSKSSEAWSNTPLKNYVGIEIKDGTKVFDFTKNDKAQCIAHIIRYLKAAFEFSNFKHIAPKQLISFFKSINLERCNLINMGINSFPDEQIIRYKQRYDELMLEWGNELDGESEIIYKEEINLWKRMNGKDKKEILYFITDFEVPFTNNNAESAQRGIKIKQKIGKFRSFTGANNYCRIKSFILTLKKRKISLLDSINKVLSNIPVLA